MIQQYNIIKLLQLLDKYIYSKLVPESSGNLTCSISNEVILELFDSKIELVNSLEFYSQTLILAASSKVQSYPLVQEYEITASGLVITHNCDGLRYYLNRSSKAMIYNGAIQLLFAKAFAKYSFNGELIYSFLSKGYEYTCTPEELRTMLEMNYQNSFLLPRVLYPTENAIRKLYDENKIPFYFTVTLKKSLLGTGRKIIEIRFEVKDYVVLLRQKRLRENYIKFIVKKLRELFPWDYPFYQHKIESMPDSTVEQIYELIKNIETDPDYNKTATSTLIKHKLRVNFDIIVQFESNP